MPPAGPELCHKMELSTIGDDSVLSMPPSINSPWEPAVLREKVTVACFGTAQNNLGNRVSAAVAEMRSDTGPFGVSEAKSPTAVS